MARVRKSKGLAPMALCCLRRIRRFASYGTTPLGSGWYVAPAILAQSSKDRYVKGDSYEWVTFNTRLIKEVTQNFALAFEGSYQYMDLKPKGYQTTTP